MSPFHERVVPLPRPVPVASVQGTLALDLGRHPDDAWPPPLATVHALERRERRRLEGWAHRFAQAAVEIAGGDRPVSQLLRWAAPDVYEDLARRAQLVRAAAAREAHGGRVQQVRPQVESLHTCWVDEGTAEVSVRVRYGRRSRAVAIRFEHRAGRWLAVALEFA
ncbi:MAG TPA: Rv3235 family protein [Nocardioides sp.]|nr:Rv3235 family protein [Nocardioides sp.]